ncbi:hypothetical protein [Pontibacillus salipaludis]|uniref:Uncharacterized protein n=1 Tax=Pontibacillus salipaludis TaxID=1697394 RepID=A0ABQ1Q5T2_9BACI|nr:hypothetical protein [Pontibacillus salipaludis]GGD12979.1 hypothetical protein GCM10011389_20700 [Pontibacillus salipaludis]
MANQRGSGTAYYIGTSLSEDAMYSLVAAIIEETQLGSIESPDGVEVSLHSGEARLYEIVMNHNNLPLSYNRYELQPYSCTFYEIVDGGKWIELSTSYATRGTLYRHFRIFLLDSM